MNIVTTSLPTTLSSSPEIPLHYPMTELHPQHWTMSMPSLYDTIRSLQLIVPSLPIETPNDVLDFVEHQIEHLTISFGSITLWNFTGKTLRIFYHTQMKVQEFEAWIRLHGQSSTMIVLPIPMPNYCVPIFHLPLMPDMPLNIDIQFKTYQTSIPIMVHGFVSMLSFAHLMQLQTHVTTKDHYQFTKTRQACIVRPNDEFVEWCIPFYGVIHSITLELCPNKDGVYRYHWNNITKVELLLDNQVYGEYLPSLTRIYDWEQNIVSLPLQYFHLPMKSVSAGKWHVTGRGLIIRVRREHEFWDEPLHFDVHIMLRTKASFHEGLVQFSYMVPSQLEVVRLNPSPLLFRIIPETEDSVCPISLQTIEPGDEYARTDCCHRNYDKHSLTRWIKEGSGQCPLCRIRLDWNNIQFYQFLSRQSNDLPNNEANQSSILTVPPNTN